MIFPIGERHLLKKEEASRRTSEAKTRYHSGSKSKKTNNRTFCWWRVGFFLFQPCLLECIVASLSWRCSWVACIWLSPWYLESGAASGCPGSPVDDWHLHTLRQRGIWGDAVASPSAPSLHLVHLMHPPGPVPRAAPSFRRRRMTSTLRTLSRTITWRSRCWQTHSQILKTERLNYYPFKHWHEANVQITIHQQAKHPWSST